MHLLEQCLVDVGHAAEAFPRQGQMLTLDRLRQLECALVVQGEQVVRHPDVVVAEFGDLAHLRHHGLDGPCAEQVAEHRLVAEVAAERAATCGHQRRGRVLPVLAPVIDVLGVGDIPPIGQREVRHVLGADPRCRPDDLAAALENQPRDLLEAAVVEVFHDLYDRLLAFAYCNQVELVDEGVGLARRVGAANYGKRLATNLLRDPKRLVLHRDHAVDADD